jgi:hypothetical protein
MIGLSYGVGNVFGPVISGFAARPHMQYPSLFEKMHQIPVLSSAADMFTKYPYLFLNTIVFSVNLLGLVLAVLFLKETNTAVLKRKEQQQQRDDEIKEQSEPLVCVDEPTLEQETEQKNRKEMEDEFNTMIKFRIPQLDQIIVVKFPSWWPKNEILRSRAPLTCSALQAFSAICNQSYLAVVPLWMMLSYENRGLAFGTQELGILGAISGVGMFLFQLLICPIVLNRLGILNALRIACFTMAVIYPFYPEISYLTGVSSTLLWGSIVAAYLIRVVCVQTVVTGSNILISNSVSSENRGKLNGAAVSINALGRAFGPLASTTIFSASTFGTVFPFDIHLTFMLIAVISLSMMLMTMLLPQSLNTPKKPSK